MYSIRLVDPQAVFRIGLRSLISTTFPAFQITDAASLAEMDHHSSDQSDLLLIDARSLEGMSVEAVRRKHSLSNATRCAVLSDQKGRHEALQFLSLGFSGFICKLQTQFEFTTAIEDLLSGRVYLPTCLIDDRDELMEAPEPRVHQNYKLTARQSDVLHLLDEGLSNKEISRRLGIAPSTTRIHVSGVLRAVGARNRTAAVFMASLQRRARRRGQP